MKQKMTGERVAYVAPGRGGSVWIGDRELVTFKQTGAETGGLFALVEVVGLPGSGPPPHIHRRVDEVYCLLEGELEVLDGDRTFTAEAGSVFRIPKGTLHAWKNETDEPARTLLFVCPAGFEGFFEEAGVPAMALHLRRRLQPKRTCGGCWSSGASMRPSTPRSPISTRRRGSRPGRLAALFP